MNLVVTPKNGSPNFSVTQNGILRQWLRKNEGKKVNITFDTRVPKRSDAQNRYLWGVYYPLLSEDLGYTIHELHTLFKGMFLTEDIKEVMGKKVRLTKSTAELNKSEFSEYIMEIEAYTEIPAPPVEDYGLAPMK